MASNAQAVEIQPTPISEPLDLYLREVVATLQSAVGQGMKHLDDESPEVVNRVVHDCEEILDVILEGNVKEWVS